MKHSPEQPKPHASGERLDTSTDVVRRFVIEAGRFVERRFIEELKNMCFARNVQIKIEMGTTSPLSPSTLRVELKGRPDDVDVVMESIRNVSQK